jgi:hypothetical protein
MDTVYGKIIRDKQFATASGLTVFRKGMISSYTQFTSENKGLRFLDVHMVCGTIFTIKDKDVKAFLTWVGEMNNDIF